MNFRLTAIGLTKMKGERQGSRPIINYFRLNPLVNVCKRMGSGMINGSEQAREIQIIEFLIIGREVLCNQSYRRSPVNISILYFASSNKG